MKVLLAFTSLLSVAMAVDIRVTDAIYPAQNDKDTICQLAFGESATLLDFNELKAMSVAEVEQLMSDLNIGISRHENHYFISVNGQSIYPGTNNHAYFFEYHGEKPPSYFDVIDSYAGLNVAVANKYGRLVCNVEGATTARRKLMEADAKKSETKAKAEPAAGKKASKSWWGW